MRGWVDTISTVYQGSAASTDDFTTYNFVYKIRLKLN